jgi:hypothetical protein
MSQYASLIQDISEFHDDAAAVFTPQFAGALTLEFAKSMLSIVAAHAAANLVLEGAEGFLDRHDL